MPSRNSAVAARQRRRRITLLWSAAVAALVIILIYKEQIAMLYVLGSLAITALLVVLIRADLSGARRAGSPAPFDDAAAAADGITAANDSRQRRAASRR